MKKSHSAHDYWLNCIASWIFHSTHSLSLMISRTTQTVAQPVSSAAEAEAADHLYRDRPPQAALLIAEPCALSGAEFQLLLLECRSPGTEPALYLAKPPVIHNILHPSYSKHTVSLHLTAILQVINNILHPSHSKHIIPAYPGTYSYTIRYSATCGAWCVSLGSFC